MSTGLGQNEIPKWFGTVNTVAQLHVTCVGLETSWNEGLNKRRSKFYTAIAGLLYSLVIIMSSSCLLSFSRAFAEVIVIFFVCEIVLKCVAQGLQDASG